MGIVAISEQGGGTYFDGLLTRETRGEGAIRVTRVQNFEKYAVPTDLSEQYTF